MDRACRPVRIKDESGSIRIVDSNLSLIVDRIGLDRIGLRLGSNECGRKEKWGKKNELPLEDNKNLKVVR